MDVFVSTVDPEGRSIQYEPWENGACVGYKVTREDSVVEYIYFCPSINSDGTDKPNVFIYKGPYGDPDKDLPQVHICQFTT